jgi:hypothetical protein
MRHHLCSDVRVKLTSAGVPDIAGATTGVPSRHVVSGYGDRQLSGRSRDPAGGEIAGASVAAGAAGAALSILVLSSLVLVSLASARPSWLSPEAAVGSYPRWLAGPLGPLTSGLNVDEQTLDISFTVLVGLMYVSYVVVLLAAPHINVKWALGAVVLVHIIFFLSPPLDLTDVFNYINYARMEVVHGLNPYVTIPALEPHTDPTFLLSNWHGLLSPYGPLFTLYTLALVPLGVVASLWLIKASLMLLSLAIIALVWRCAEMLGRRPLTAALFVGLNPLVLVWGLGGDHNDFFMVFLVVLAIYLLLRAEYGPRGERRAPAADSVVAAPRGQPAALSERKSRSWRELGAGVSIAFAVAVKASCGILVPIFILGSLRRTRFTLGLIVGAIAAGVATLLAFGPNLPNITQQDGLVDRQSVPNIIGYIAGLGGENQGLHRLLTIVLVLGILYCAVWAARTRDWLTASGYATLLVLLTLSWTLPSYIVWLLPFAALATGRSLRVATIVFGVYVFLFWMPYSMSLENALDLHLVSTTLAHSLANSQHQLQF